MARKFGEKREICIDPLAYNIGLIGESGIGKSTAVSYTHLTLPTNSRV